MTDRSGAAKDLYFATTDKVWAFSDDGATVSPKPLWTGAMPGSMTLPSPSTPILYDTRLYVGAGDGSLHVLDPSNGSDAVPPILLGDGLATVGSPTIDTRDSFLYVGSEAGVIYKVQRP
jgi:outer membrane protein assembly factor BamB